MAASKPFPDNQQPSPQQPPQPSAVSESPKRSKPVKVVQNAVSSTLGAAVVGFAVTPLDVVKVRLQAHVCPVGGSIPCEDPRHVAGTLDATRKIVRKEGLRGLWRGLNATLILSIPTTGMYFTMYESFRDDLAHSYPNWSLSQTSLLAGASARLATATIASPLELARTSLQAGVGGPSATVGSVIRHVATTQGPLALWRGLGPTLLRDAPFSAIYWSMYEALKDPSRSWLPHRIFTSGSELAVYMGAGVGAGTVAALCTVPADLVKTRRQASFIGVNSKGGSGQVPSSIKIVRDIVNRDGLRGLFRGAGPRVAKVAPACAIMMGSFEMFRKVLDRLSH